MAEGPVLSLNNVTKRFGGLVAVNGLSFDMQLGEIVGLIGPNGSGKTTAINLISGALGVSGGTIALDGEVISRSSASAIARKGVVRTFQLVRLLPALSVLENVMAGGVFGHGRRWGPDLDAHARAMLARVGIDGDGQAPVQSLTYIDQKRVELARALVADPKVLLLDEWLAGLNPTELRTGIALIEGLRGEGRTILIVEHVMDAIRSLCGRCVVMNNGIKIAEGTPHEVLSDHDVIAAYLGDVNA